MSEKQPWDRPNHPAVTQRNGNFRRLVRNLRKQREQDERSGALYDAMHEIANLPEQGGCGDGIDAVDLWMLMQKKARAALDAYEQADTKQAPAPEAK